MPDGEENKLLRHLEALRVTLLRIVLGTAILYPLGYVLAPYAISALIACCLPEEMGTLRYFSPMEVFFVQLKLALVIALILAYPWNMAQIWRFVKPALYIEERRQCRIWLTMSTGLFLVGVGVCLAFILPLIMRFSAGFSTQAIQPMIGLSAFLSLAGWLSLAFGCMFQVPVVTAFAVKAGLISVKSLKQKRPYVLVAILILSAILTPPDVISQIMLALPAYLLFEIGIWLMGGPSAG